MLWDVLGNPWNLDMSRKPLNMEDTMFNLCGSIKGDGSWLLVRCLIRLDSKEYQTVLSKGKLSKRSI